MPDKHYARRRTDEAGRPLNWSGDDNLPTYDLDNVWPDSLVIAGVIRSSWIVVTPRDRSYAEDVRIRVWGSGDTPPDQEVVFRGRLAWPHEQGHTDVAIVSTNGVELLVFNETAAGKG